MTRRELMIVSGLGLLGYLCFLLLFPRLDPSANYDLAVDRQKAIQKARELAAGLGLEAENWTAYTTAQVDEKGAYYRSIHPPEQAHFLTSLNLRVKLVGASSREFLTVYLGSDGSPYRIEKRRPTRPDDDEELPALEEPQIRAAMQLLAADEWAAFEPSEEPSTSRGITTLEFTASSLNGPDRIPRITLQSVGDEVYLIRGYPGYSEQFDDSFDDLEDPLEILLVCIIFATIIGITAGLARYALAIYDRAVEHRRVVVLALLVAAADALLLFFGDEWQAAGVENDGLIEVVVVFILKNVFLVGPFLFATWGAGAVISDSGSVRKKLHLDLLLQGETISRPVAQAVAFGGMFSGLLLSIPYLLKGLGILPAALPAFLNPTDWYAAVPPITLLRFLSEGPLMPVFGVVALAYPWLAALLKRRILLYPLRISLLAVFLSQWGFQYSLMGGAATGLLSALLIDWIYRRSGLLATMSCAFFAVVLSRGMSMASQPDSAVSFDGWMVVLAGFGILLASAYFSVRGKELDFEAQLRKATDEAARKSALRRGERERLLAEFGVARRAQELMLPAEPPQLPGVEIAASCTPAREVGGDLFDFVRMADGRTGIVVADVSGKGVPAALYMTLAKGLLSSVAEAATSAADIVRQVNGHFHACAQKRVFATLALTVLDAERGVVECARAGHNPVLWQRPSLGELQTVSPSGIGVGLAPNRLFSRSLSVETCEVQSGDTFFIYSDGIPEAMNEQRDEYGMERFEAAIQETDGMSATQAHDHLVKRVGEFVGKTPASDDLTLVVVRFLKEWATAGV